MDTGKTEPVAADRPESPIFAAIITPHRSLREGTFRVVMVLCALVSLVVSVPFVILGFWPVAGFFGLDLLLLYVAFRINFRQGRSMEEIVLTPIELLLRRVSDRGERREWRFNPLWTRLARREDDEFGLLQLAVTSRGQEVVIARDLSPPERASFADALGRALADVKRGY